MILFLYSFRMEKTLLSKAQNPEAIERKFDTFEYIKIGSGKTILNTYVK